jgi:type VI secretion system secreted protein VgrG
VWPWLWFLTRTADCRIFQDKTAHEIILEVFKDEKHHGVPDYEDHCTGKYATREYCVQYRETDFNFVSRLMEEEGIYYYFEHSDGRHVLKLVDAHAAHKPLPHRATIAYFPPGYQIRTDDEYIHDWTFDQGIQPGLVTLRDYDFTKPKADLTVKNRKTEKHEHAGYEIFDWPGEYRETDDGDHLARARVDELHAEFERAQAGCNVREIAVGGLFTLANFPRPDQNRQYLIVSADWDLLDNPYESSPGAAARYGARFTALPSPSDRQFRPARVTPEPKVAGPQTAVVVGPAGEEIWTDKYGRVKVQFHWDRYGKKNENSSCWIRVSSPWAGANWGAVALPRIGQEVIVDFLEGDPDQPIITGRVYNADQMPPYALPGNKTQSGMKSRSSLGGSASNFNEIRFEDKKGSEQVFVHGEKDMDTRVKNISREWIGADRHLIVTKDRNEQVGQNYYVKSGMKIVIESGMELTIKSSGGFIKIDPMGITIVGNLVLINSGGAPGTIPKAPDEAKG